MAEKGWISPRSVVQGSGLDYDAEQSTIAQDINKIVRNALLAQQVGGGAEGGAGGAGPAGGVGVAPGEPEEGGVGVGAPAEGPTPPGGAGGETPSASAQANFIKQAAKTDEAEDSDLVVPFDKPINFIEEKKEPSKPKMAVESLIEREIETLDRRTDLFVTGK